MRVPVNGDAGDHKRNTTKLDGRGHLTEHEDPNGGRSAGSRESRRANVARGSRDIANWSVTYGITDEQIPTPIPAPRRDGYRKVGTAPAMPSGVTATSAMSMEAPSRSIPLPPPS